MTRVGTGGGSQTIRLAQAGRPGARSRPTAPTVKAARVEAAREGPAGLEPFASYYPAAKRALIALPEGKESIETFTLEQIRAIHRLYFSVGPGVSFSELEKRCQATPELRGRKKPRHENFIELFRAMRTHFPWSWKGRSFIASSHALVDALLTTPEGTTYGEVIARLRAQHGRDFSSAKALEAGARSLWSKKAADFPFAARLPKKDRRRYNLRAMAAETELRYDVRGRLNVNAVLAERVRAYFDDPRFMYHLTQREFCDLVAEEIPTFATGHYNKLSADFGLSTYERARKVALRRLCETIQHLHRDEKMEQANDVLDALHERFGYPRFEPPQLSFFRREYPDLVPDFRQTKIESRRDSGKRLVAAIKADPKTPWLRTGRKLGYSTRELGRIFHALRRYDRDALPFGTSNRWSPEDVAILRRTVDAAPIGATTTDLLDTLRRDSPELFLRHDMGGELTLSLAIRKHLGIANWQDHTRARFEAAFAEAASKSPEAGIMELARHMREIHPSAYCPGYVVQLAQKWRSDPEAHPAIAALRDPEGLYPWDRARIEHTPTLAKRIGEVIKNNPGRLLSEYAALLMSDPGFAARWPTFKTDHIAAARVRFPKLVPYVDELKVGGRAEWLAGRYREMQRLAVRAMKVVAKIDPEDLTLLGVARALGVPDTRVLRAAERFPDLFPWYRPSRSAGTQDLLLATRVAHEMETAPVGTTLPELVTRLHQDPDFHAAYPFFTVNSFGSLRDGYPELVPEWATRNQVLRSKMLVDALLTAPRGQRYEKVLARLRHKHPGAFPAAYDRADYVLAHWEANPERFPFVAALKHRGRIQLMGIGAPDRIQKSEPNLELAARLARLESMPDRLPLMEAVAEKLPAQVFEDCECVAIQHLLDSQVPTFATYKKLGLSQSRTTVIGVPYSASGPVVERLEDDGWNVRVPPLDLAAWKQQIKEALLERIDSALEHNRKILVLDDGGLVAELLDSDPELAPYAKMFKIVEQTTRGIRVAEGTNLRAPLVDVGTSWDKYVEGPLIGGDVSEKLIERLLGIGIKDLKGKRIGVCGYGTIGEPLIQALRALGAIVTVLDTDPTKMEAADQKQIPIAKDRKSFFSGQDIIIGATGEQSIRAEDLQYLKNGTVLASASSKLVEIDVGALSEASMKGGRPRVETVDADHHPPTVEYTLSGGRKIRLLASGFPINFDGGPENIPPEEIQLTRTLMLIGAAQAVGAKVAGFNMLDTTLQLDALEVLEGLGVLAKKKKAMAALSLAKLRLREAQENPGAVNRRLHRG